MKPKYATLFTLFALFLAACSLYQKDYDLDPTPSQTVSTPTQTIMPESHFEIDNFGIRAFYLELNAAISARNTDFLISSLHPAVLEVYGESRCQIYFINTFSNAFDVQVIQWNELSQWEWQTDGKLIPIENAFSVEVILSRPDATVLNQTKHLAVRPDGTLGWFADCGEPIFG